MYYFKEFAKKYDLENQLADCRLYITDDRLVIDNSNYRLSVYGWPDNRVVTMNKISGIHKIRRFGPSGKDKCQAFIMDCLAGMGVDTLEGDWDQEKIKLQLRDSLCDECRTQE